MHFDDADEICACISDKGYEGKCSSDPMLHFPYAKDLNYITCNKAQSIPVNIQYIYIYIYIYILTFDRYICISIYNINIPY